MPNWIDLSKLYYVAKDKGFLKELDVPLFAALYRKNKPLSDWVEDIDKFATPFAQKVDSSITTEKFIDLMEASELEDIILADNDRIMELMLSPTPVLVVRFNDGFYKINIKSARKNKTYQNLVKYIMQNKMQHLT